MFYYSQKDRFAANAIRIPQRITRERNIQTHTIETWACATNAIDIADDYLQ